MLSLSSMYCLVVSLRFFPLPEQLLYMWLAFRNRAPSIRRGDTAVKHRRVENQDEIATNWTIKEEEEIKGMFFFCFLFILIYFIRKGAHSCATAAPIHSAVDWNKQVDGCRLFIVGDISAAQHTQTEPGIRAGSGAPYIPSKKTWSSLEKNVVWPENSSLFYICCRSSVRSDETPLRGPCSFIARIGYFSILNIILYLLYRGCWTLRESGQPYVRLFVPSLPYVLNSLCIYMYMCISCTADGLIPSFLDFPLSFFLCFRLVSLFWVVLRPI